MKKQAGLNFSPEISVKLPTIQKNDFLYLENEVPADVKRL
jgi:hypothetical protein